MQNVQEGLAMMDFYETDPEFVERMEYFTLEEVVKEPG